ncbi:DedA family protein, partial [Campylobacter jejuni]|nr:DedA family protein [Campylobacter jejuni]HEG8064080.1 DedA family protein [Campylobacter jejuni]
LLLFGFKQMEKAILKDKRKKS